MKTIITLLTLALSFLLSYSQDKADGYFVVYLMDANSEDLKCEVFPNPTSNDDIQNLMNNGRYVISAVNTKFGVMVLHRKSKQIESQRYVCCKVGDEKKYTKKLLKEGYIVQSASGFRDNHPDFLYTNTPTRHIIFNNNCSQSVTKQKIYGWWNVNQKKITNVNKKGLYIKTFLNDYIGQDRNDVDYQIFKSYDKKEDFYSDFDSLSREGFLVGSVYTSYNSYGDYTYYKVFFDKPKNEYKGKQHLIICEDEIELESLLAPLLDEGCEIACIWGGWEDEDYDWWDSHQSNENNIFDILSGITSTAIQLANKSGTSNGINNNHSTTERSTSEKHKSDVTNSCKSCSGTGTCSIKNGTARKAACHGSGLCGFCNGTGWIAAGSSKAICKACDGKGKCKTCHGSGKCPDCNGKGHK